MHSSLTLYKDLKIKEVKYNGNNKMGSIQRSNHNKGKNESPF